MNNILNIIILIVLLLGLYKDINIMASGSVSKIFSIPLKTLEGNVFNGDSVKDKVTLITNVACQWYVIIIRILYFYLSFHCCYAF